ncbi:MAG: hypothetical protein Q7T55_04965 [Solirubrobacteraceae bacterium]|nr:hypothetical protein [Solirubrobacteraceae bacterium]
MTPPAPTRTVPQTPPSEPARDAPGAARLHPRSSRLRRPTVAVIITTVLATAPVIGVTSASADALGDTSSTSWQQAPDAASSARPKVTVAAKNDPGTDLDVAPDWNAPGVRQGKELIGWAKAGAIIFGVLGLMGGLVLSKVLKESGNHHASGVRTTAMGVGGALVLAGAAPELVPWLMG